MRKPVWWRIQRALKDPLQRFVCVEGDLTTAEGTARHQDAFMADEWIRHIFQSPAAGEVWLKATETPLPGAHDWQSFIDMRKAAFYAVLHAALRQRWRQDKRDQREARRLASFDAMTEMGMHAAPLWHEDPAPLDLESLFDSLTEREGQVAILLAIGLSQVDVAAELSLSPGRVSQITASLRKKLL